MNFRFHVDFIGIPQWKHTKEQTPMPLPEIAATIFKETRDFVPGKNAKITHTQIE
jgi:hypothetical protein